MVMVMVGTVFSTSPAQANDSDNLTSEFHTKILPIFREHCYDCHSHRARNVKGGLLLDSSEALEKGGDSGPLIDRKHPESSLLWQAVDPSNKDLRMPPENPIPDLHRRILVNWMKNGANIPNDFQEVSQENSQPTRAFNLRERAQNHWAWQPVRRIPSHLNIDSLIERKLKEKGLERSPNASPSVLIRRLSLQLTGMVPTPEECIQFQADYSKSPETALRDWTDKFLTSPAFGEHWARMWMDVVRFSETKGHVTDQERPFAWKYRDYLIHAFNSDLPYNRFIIEHLAGDVLPPESDRQGWNGQTMTARIATGILFMHEMHFMAVDPVRQRWDEINAQIEVVGKGFLGLTLDCARCHDHKFDAISQKDYYALAGFFLSTEQGRLRTAPRSNQIDPNHVQLEEKFEKFLSDRREGRVKAQKPKADAAYFPVSEELGVQSPNDTRTLMTIISELRDGDPNWAMWTRSAIEAAPQDAPLLIRGSAAKPGDTVSRRFLEAINPNIPQNLNGSGRLWLARQIASKDNPLTARVWVNRIWQQLFGRGIVATPDNFGSLGEPPTNPELLDFLANDFIDNGWSTKKLIRDIIASRTWQQSSSAPQTSLDADPENRYFARQNRRRLTAEQIRDSILSISGELDPALYGPSIDCYIPPYATANKTTTVPNSGPLDGFGRRSIYLKIRRNFYDQLLLAFDFPDRSQSISLRQSSPVPTQSLALMNSPFVHEMAARWGRKLHPNPKDNESILKYVWMACTSETPNDIILDELSSLYRELQASPLTQAEVWQHLTHAVMNAPSFIYCP